MGFYAGNLETVWFLVVFIDWIAECITSAHFSVCLNGDIYGYFAGARVLRQGEPMSPYLFVLVMEVLQMIIQQFIDQDEGFTYHWKCGNMGLFHLCFADDLLLLCHADVSLVNVFRHGLEMFATLSGLTANPQKSHLIISKVAQANREALFRALDFEEGHLPLRYLGLPLIAPRLTISDCKPLLLKIDSRIQGWDGIRLSFVGRLQLIKSVLLAFIFPKGIIKEVEKRLRSFLWKGTSNRGYPKDSVWVDWIVHNRLRDQTIWTASEKTGSWSWRKLLKLRIVLLPHIQYRIGDGVNFSLWKDPWHSLGPLIDRFPVARTSPAPVSMIL
ncbi:UNVERIFIED_CONTAM: LINE-1 retrotransposable element O protein [Sesamum latifolium]|uniref:LINE-1 retrotransposable element O protein n=1 Tax=Sesamum latifolium TaxID=2727402 RepID=A0AAW2WWR2_9LAMI